MRCRLIICPWFIFDTKLQSITTYQILAFSIKHSINMTWLIRLTHCDWKKRNDVLAIRLLLLKGGVRVHVATTPLNHQNPNNNKTLGTGATNQNLHFRDERLRPLSNQQLLIGATLRRRGARCLRYPVNYIPLKQRDLGIWSQEGRIEHAWWFWISSVLEDDDLHPSGDRGRKRSITEC